MIEIRNWFVRVPDNEYLLGYLGEHLARRIVFLLAEPGYGGWEFKLDVKRCGKKDVLALVQEEALDGLRLSVDVDRGLLLRPGTITAQIRAFNREGRERHTNQFYFSVRDSVQPGEAFPTPLPSEFYQMEAGMGELLRLAREAAAQAGQAADRADLVRQFKTYLEFPSLGTEKTIYMDAAANKAYRWDEVEKKYYVVGSDYGQIKIIDGGNADV